MLHLILTYWPVLLLLYAPRLAQLVAVVIATRTQGKLDHRIPDDLPMTAGEWLASRLAVLPIGVTAVVTDKYDDGYRPLAKVIQLRAITHFKADPVYWATAAHELGHAYHRHTWPVLGALRTLSNLMLFPLLAVGVGGLAGYVLYAIPLAGVIAFACFAVASALRVFVLVDEAAASIYAYRELRANDAIDFVHLRAIRTVLLAYFATYFVTYASHALLLTQWALLDALVQPAAHYSLTTLGWIFVVLLSAASAVALKAKEGWLRWIPITALVLLVWNVIDPAYAWCVLFALGASFHVWQRLAYVPFALPFIIVTLFAKKFEGPGVHRTVAFDRLLLRGKEAIAAGNRRIDALQEQWTKHSTVATRAWSFVRLGVVPLLVAIWL